MGVETAFKPLAIVGVLILTRGFLGFFADLKKHEAAFDVANEVRVKLIDKLKLFGLGFYTNQRLGEINTVLQKDVNNMSEIVGHVWAKMFADILIATVTMIGLFIYDFRFALAMVALMPFIIWFLYQSVKKSDSIERTNSDALMNIISNYFSIAPNKIQERVPLRGWQDET